MLSITIGLGNQVVKEKIIPFALPVNSMTMDLLLIIQSNPSNSLRSENNNGSDFFTARGARD
ncbi:MAG: hypothetical protein RIS84_1135 [Pseudomonadota bacterium]|jgi:hypothetical protein